MTMTEYTITLSWPNRALHSNSRAHWAVKSRATKSYRGEAWAVGKVANLPFWPNAILEFTFHPPHLKYDVQNIPSSLKAAIDGIADAMGCDDRKFRVRYPSEFAEKVKNGSIVVTVKEND